MNRVIKLGDNTDRGFASYLYTTFSIAYGCFVKKEKFFIDWTQGVHYLSPDHGINPYEYFFKQPYKVGGEKLEIANNISLELREDVVIEDRLKWNKILTKCLILKSKIRKEIDAYYMDNFLNKNILCVHRRGTDHGYHCPILSNDYFFEKIDEELANKSYDKIFLATDEEHTVEEFKKKYGDKLLFLDNIRVSGPIPIFKSTPYKYQHTKEVIKDIYLLSMGNKLIKTRSTMTTISCYLNKDLDFINIDSHLTYEI